MIYSIKPQIKRPDIALYKNIVYKNALNDFKRLNCPLTLDFMRPYYQIRNWEKLPLLIWAEGGAWRSSPSSVRIPELAYYAYHGYAVAGIQYRVSSQSLWPAQIEDVKTAIRYLKAHAEQLGIDPNRIAIAGESAGAHLSALAALTGDTDRFRTNEWNQVDDRVQAAICWYGPSDFITQEDMEQTKGRVSSPVNLLINGHIKDHPEKAAEISTLTYVDKKAPPFLLFHGTEDSLVSPSHTQRLYDKLVESGTEVDYYQLEGAEHASIEFAQEEVQKIMLDFLDRHLKQKAEP